MITFNAPLTVDKLTDDIDKMQASNTYMHWQHRDYKMDNGEDFPERKPFLNTKWNQAKRTFTGVLDFRSTPIHGGTVREDWTIVFSKDY